MIYTIINPQKSLKFELYLKGQIAVNELKYENDFPVKNYSNRLQKRKKGVDKVQLKLRNLKKVM